MSESMDDVRYDIANTRQHMSDTLAELEARLGERREAVTGKVHAVRETLDPAKIGTQVGELIQAHPLAAVAVAFGLGLFLGRSGADRTLAAGTGDALRNSSRAALDATRSAAGAVVERVRGGSDAGTLTDVQVPLESGYLADDQAEPNIVDRLALEVGRALRFDALEHDMRSVFTSQKLPTSI